MADDRDRNVFIIEDDEPVSRESAPPDGSTRAFVMETPGKEPSERCEERGSIPEQSTGMFVWRVLRPLVILIVSVALVWLVGSGAYHYVVNNYIAPVEGDTSVTKTVEIKAGSSLSKIATLLYEQGIIRNKLVFQLYVDFNDMSSKLQAGTYELSPGMEIKDIMAALVAGDGEEEVIRVTLTEGMTAYDMAKTLMAKGVFNDTERREFLKLCNNLEAFDDYDFIAALPDTTVQDGRRFLLEGYLFPDTYDFYADATPEEVIRKLLSGFDTKFSLQFEERAAELGLTVDQVMTMASIIEWEAVPGDFKKVSAVLHNRLDKSMKLQCDSTLRYVTGEKKLTYTPQELALESPYNTYQIKGLPIGPIANPGQQAIEAALYPDEEYVADEYLYFCNKSPDSSELAFARTLEEHNANKAAYNEAAGNDVYDTDN